MELWDIYDADKKPTGRTMKRNDWCLKDGLNDQQCDKMRDCNRKGKAEPPHFLCTNLFPVDKQC